MAFFQSAVGVLQTLVVALGAGLGIWGAINLMEGYGNDNPGANAHVRQRSTKQNKDSQPCHYSEVRGTQQKNSQLYAILNQHLNISS